MRDTKSLAVPTGGPTISSTLTLNGREVVVGVQLSATFDGTSLTLKGAAYDANGVGSPTLVPVKDKDNNAVAITISDDTAGYYAIDPVYTYGLRYVGFLSDAAQSAGSGEIIRVAVAELPK